MTETLNVKAVATKNEEGKTIYERSLDVPMLTILKAETLADMVKQLGEDYCMHTLKAGIKTACRSRVRTQMEKRDDNGDFEFSDEAILASFDPNWTPELRVTKTPEEKALAALEALDPETRKLVIAQTKKLKE